MLNVKNEVLIRVYSVAAVVLVVAVVILTRLFQLTVTDAHKWEAKADSLYVKLVDVPSQRGNILADDGSLLATSLPFFDIHFDAKAEGLTPEIFNDQAVDSLSWLLSTYIDQQYTPGAYRQWFDTLRNADPKTRGIRYVPIAKGLPYSKMMLIKTFPIFREGRQAGGFIAEQISRRERPFKILAQRTIGYASREGALPVGIEGSFFSILEGKKENQPQQLMLRVPGDIYIPVNDLAEIEPASGDDVVTTLDINIQDAAETALLNACETHNADHGCAIVMEVKTGKIRAMANIGRSETEGKKGYWETYNYAVGERVEPGSMFKLASFMAMMEAGELEDFDEKVPVFGGKVKIYDEELIDAVPHGLDSMTIRQIFAQSSNVGTATLTQRFFKSKPAAFVQQLRDFNLDQPTGIEIGGEENPIVKNPEDPKSEWSGTTLPWMSIGYELLLTPLQLLTFYNAVANEGRMMKPYLVQRTEHYGEIIKEFRPYTIKRSIASKNTLRKAKELLREVVTTGTAKNIYTPLYDIAGKTGTAQLNYHKFRVSKGLSHQAGFCGFFPADDPVYSCIVVISEPDRGGYHGAEVAAPVFRQIADKCFAMKAELHKPINADKAQALKYSQLPSYDAGSKEDMKESLKWLGLSFESAPDLADWGVVIAKDSLGLSMQNRAVGDKNIPSVVGMGLKDAIYLLENRGCRVRVEGVGKVRRQSLAPGTRANGQTCVLFWNRLQKKQRHKTLKAKRSVKLKHLLQNLQVLETLGSTDIEIGQIRFDSRAVQPGDVFVAVRGAAVDGHQFIDKAIENGAVAAVYSDGVTPSHPVTTIRVADSAEALGQMASSFYGNPSEEIALVGITGTNGKTTTATLLWQLFTALGYKCGLIGTVENRVGEEVLTSTHTTPDAVRVHALLRQMADAGCSHVFMEVSSHAVHQRRIAGVRFVGGVFTNLTHDHLDYHQTFAEYRDAKKKFFDDLPKTAFALTNGDDKNGSVMLQNTRAGKYTYGLKKPADFKVKIIENSLEGLHLELDGAQIHARMIGEFNAYNLTAAYGVAMLLAREKTSEVLRTSEVYRTSILTTLSNLPGAEGRFDYINHPSKPGCIGIVDYAHTPDALEKVLETIAKLKKKTSKVITVTGAGGDRDKTKRPIMAQVSARFSDQLILTSDNPRTEDPAAILQDMEAGLDAAGRKKTLTIQDREQAIRTAIRLAGPNDVVLVAGKGHEKYQDIQGVKYPFDDKAVLLRTMRDEL